MKIWFAEVFSKQPDKIPVRESNTTSFPMNYHHCSFVRFRAIPPEHVANLELESGIATHQEPFPDAIYRAEPIRVLQSSFDMDIDGPTTKHIHHKKRGLEEMAYHATTRKRQPTTGTHRHGTSQCNNNDHSSSQLHALSIDLIVSHIIGFLPWKQQIVSCSRVSKLWNQASLTAPMRVLVFPQKKDEQSHPLPRVLEPCRLERSLNEMSWKIFDQMHNTKVLSKIKRLDIWGDVHWHDNAKKQQRQDVLSNMGQLEELYLRYMSLENLLDIFPESQHPRFLQLTKLVIQEWSLGSARKEGTEIGGDTRALLRQRILFHAPNVLILKASI